MNRLLDSILYKRYPNLYRYRHTKNMSEWSCCGDGSFSLIDVMSQLIVKHAPCAYATKVKRGRSGISFECNIKDDYTDGVKLAGETLSNYLCDLCGAPGTEDQSYKLDFDVIRCKEHISDQHIFLDYDLVSFDCLKDKPAWSRNVSILNTLVYWEINNKRSRTFYVSIDQNNQIVIKFLGKTDFIRGLADVFAGYCNRIDERTGKVLCNQPPLSNLKVI